MVSLLSNTGGQKTINKKPCWEARLFVSIPHFYEGDGYVSYFVSIIFWMV